MPELVQQHTVVVGAGISGLAAARALGAAGVSQVVIVEATNRPGGRIKQVENLVAWPVELGPEFIHGANSSLKAILADMGCKLREKAWPDFWYFGAEQRLVHSTQQDEDVARVMDLMDSVADTASPKDDTSARQWLLSHDANKRMLAIADACHATDFGCSLDDLGLREMIIENQCWDSGETYMLLDRSLQSLVDHLAKPLQQQILYNWPVHKISYTRDGAVLYGPQGRRKHCKRVVVTASLAVLQQNKIMFDPPLPDVKRKALSRLGMTNAIKVILAFSTAFWPEQLFDVVCTDSFIPEFWITSYPPAEHRSLRSPPLQHDSEALHAVVGFMTGRRAVSASSMTESDITERTLQQLDCMFGHSSETQPATKAFVRAHVADWSKEPYVGGCYSHPSLGAHAGDRARLADPIGNTVFFAGEATHQAVNPCLQAAFDTGERAAREILASLPQPKL